MLNDRNWESETLEMSFAEKVEYLNKMMESAVSSVFDDLLKRKVSKRKKIPKEVRALFRRKIIVFNKIIKTKLKRKLILLREEFENL